MKRLIHCFVITAAAWLTVSMARAGETKVLYENNFERAEAGKVPDDFLVLDGGFEVKEEGTNKFLELPGAPLDSFGVMFGPVARTNIAVSARIQGTKKGRRFPTFAVGLDGQAGYKLQVSPGKGVLELYKGDTVLTNVPCEWKSGEWTWLKLQITHAGAGWKIEGKAWTQGTTEPAQSTISFDETTEPSAGRASIWGSPVSTTPVQFDDLKLQTVEPEK